ncbi:MAG: GntR family transcriptional regulator, partial [Rhodococcus sp. (in: high G+C Gram-positive bacteria)]
VRLRHEHRGLVDAVRAGDATLARKRIVEHIRGYYAQSFGADAF